MSISKFYNIWPTLRQVGNMLTKFPIKQGRESGNSKYDEEDMSEGSFNGEEEVLEIMQSVVAPKTALNYVLCNTTFILYIYDNNENINTPKLHDLFEPWFLDCVSDLSEEQQKRITKSIVLDMEGSLDNCPVILDGLTFKVFSEFVASKRIDGKMLLKAT